MVWDPTVALMARLKAGERADAICAIGWALDQLAAEGRIVPGSRRPVARAVFGLAVAQGAPRPALPDADALRAFLLEAPRIVWSRAGASGIYFERLIDRLGIGDVLRARGIVIPAGFTGEVLARGDATVAVQQQSELLAVPGIDYLGPFPPDVQEPTDFDAAIFADAADPVGAARFVELLTGPDAAASYLRAGLQPRCG
jgi:molybdate transport system substrate-binding protein